MRYILITTLLVCNLFAGDYEMAWKHYNNKDYKNAVKYWTLSANKGHAKAQLNLGIMYYKGLGVEQNKIYTYNWWIKSSMNGNANARKYLEGLCRKSPSACKLL